jgi:hypothetical protein
MNDGYILDNSGSVGFGFFEAQATEPLTNSSINGTFAGGPSTRTVSSLYYAGGLSVALSAWDGLPDTAWWLR